ncbi:hypothetical protein M758_4G092200 [Ceratodon purpureus]|uniref:Uncharacterized protein n=1 Tax=Ceratodon purpureus TaxID=3225 RepID=A0A8T0I8Q0_CERPU|nr:hypothetical protein KC19_4G091700 [Ceratodon purpureus]KAG0618801.1 hypothetical protein M758_4G092200 [Ceratodon purpureus]
MDCHTSDAIPLHTLRQADVKSKIYQIEEGIYIEEGSDDRLNPTNNFNCWHRWNKNRSQSKGFCTTLKRSFNFQSQNQLRFDGIDSLALDPNFAERSLNHSVI